MNPQTTFAGGRNIFAGLQPSAEIKRDSWRAPPEEGRWVPPIDTVAPQVGATFRVRCGLSVVIVGKTKHGRFWGREVGADGQSHAWQPTGRWSGYRSATPYDLVELLKAADTDQTLAKRTRRTKNDARFVALEVGKFIECPSEEAENLQSSLIKWHKARGYEVIVRRKKVKRGGLTSRVELVRRIKI